MQPHREFTRFALAHLRNFAKRVFYNYFIRSFSLASLELVLGLALCFFGTVFGLANWNSDIPATSGTVMVAALPIVVGTQLLLAFLNYDIQSVPASTLHLRLKASAQPMKALSQWDGSRSARVRNIAALPNAAGRPATIDGGKAR